MPLGDGQTWDETQPTQQTAANTEDAISRDIRVGTRLRMQNEHVWPSSQTGTNQAGYHTYLTFPSYTAFPGLVGSGQVAGVYVDTSLGFNFYNGSTSVPLVPTILNYGSASSSSTSQIAVKICYGQVPGTNANYTIGNLPFLNATSYRVVANVYTQGPGFVAQVSSQAADSFVLGANSTAAINWIAIGI